MLSPTPTPTHPQREAGALAPRDAHFLAQEPFLYTLYLERKRAERSGRRFVLMLLESGSLVKAGARTVTLDTVLDALSRATRETDVQGWYATDTVVGVIFTEVGPSSGRSVAAALLSRITGVLAASLSIEEINEIRLSFHVFPDDWDSEAPGGSSDAALYPDLFAARAGRKGAHIAKRCMDVAGSLAALVFLSPVFAAIAVAVKLTSRGPVLFRQERVGQLGRRFVFLKFRSMQVANDPRIHEDYIRSFIQGANGSGQQPGAGGLYKLTVDPRITPVGRFLRRTSLDELPQFFNVLKGEMSLVGPRPAIPYEVRCYDTWHKRRVLAAKPGITGLWQVEGRSRVKFDDMVRMDLEYAKSWTPWLDLKILFRTPRAVFSGNGAC